MTKITECIPVPMGATFDSVNLRNILIQLLKGVLFIAE